MQIFYTTFKLINILTIFIKIFDDEMLKQSKGHRFNLEISSNHNFVYVKEGILTWTGTVSIFFPNIWKA